MPLWGGQPTLLLVGLHESSEPMLVAMVIKQRTESFVSEMERKQDWGFVFLVDLDNKIREKIGSLRECWEEERELEGFI